MIQCFRCEKFVKENEISLYYKVGSHPVYLCGKCEKPGSLEEISDCKIINVNSIKGNRVA